MNCSLWGSPVHEIFQARILEWVAISFSRSSSQPRDQTQVSCIAGRFFTDWQAYFLVHRCYRVSVLSHVPKETSLERSLWGIFYKGTNPIHRAPPSWLKYQRLHLLIPIPLRARISTYEFSGDASIHTIVLMCIYFFPFIFINWRLTTLQYCSGFCHTLTWISHVMCIYFAGYHYCYTRLSNGSSLCINLFLLFSFCFSPHIPVVPSPPSVFHSFSFCHRSIITFAPYSVSLYMTCVPSLFPPSPSETWLPLALDATE